MRVDNLKKYIQQKEYDKAISLLKEAIKEYVISILKKQDSTFEYTSLFALDKECENHFKDKNIIKKVFYIGKDTYFDKEEELENLMDIYINLVRM